MAYYERLDPPDDPFHYEHMEYDRDYNDGYEELEKKLDIKTFNMIIERLRIKYGFQNEDLIELYEPYTSTEKQAWALVGDFNFWLEKVADSISYEPDFEF